ncbi:hypothetical protein [Thalassospira lucentensis]|uniref:hypothetical protein n=1 Tax=Thalassospira lucentensis TaxID=168935 RepID=UPI0003B40C1A|nr:hypothetical protein [Thalassospira lucentensis]RCK22617.1 hypothetical protein TH1_17175 [Thalassospira lucentensis MCCC 1A00383 = DSM 14000]
MTTKPQKMCRAIILSTALAFTSAGMITAATAQTKNPTLAPIPAGFNFPTPGYVIQQWITNAGSSDQTVSANALKNIRDHGWDLWNGMTQMTSISSGGATIAEIEVPIWTTWPDHTQALKPIFSKSGASELLFEQSEEIALRRPKQFSHSKRAGPKAKADAQPSVTYTLEVEQFNRTWVTSANTPQIVPFGQGIYSILGKSNIDNYANDFPAGYSAGARAILDFDARAIETKPVYYALKSTGTSIMPYWQGLAASATTNTTNPTPETWKTCVIVDADNHATAGMRKANPDEQKGAYAAPGLQCESYLYAPIGMMFVRSLNAGEAAAFTGQPDITAGDFGALMAMHVNSKETDSWTWQTFYWQGNEAFETDSPGSLAAQPSSLAAPWSSYAMCTAYDQSYDGGATMNLCYNPYLETSPGIPDGIQSNCVSCHGSANVAATGATNAPGYPANYDAPIDFGGPDFTNVMKTDFSWTIADQ